MPREVSKGKPTTHRYSEEEKAAAVRMVELCVRSWGVVVLTTEDLRSLPATELRAHILGSIRAPRPPGGAGFGVSA